ncbi:MAG: IPT/TIG domain-containing protein, partial [Polyangiaceae bacterium]|nr:IPT/TIG domain-containing protein [Polyangiaceae bacterium]
MAICGTRGVVLLLCGLSLSFVTGCSESEEKNKCDQDTSPCPGAGADLMSDPSNCGGYGVICPGGMSCSSGLCCPATSRNCGGLCVDLTSDAHHCGECGNACLQGEVCSSGSCGISCLPGMLDCNGGCIDPMTSNASCGASADCQGANAGTACISGQFCSNGMCGLSCPVNSIPCGTGSSAYCAYTQVDRVNCGACGTICNPGEVCQASACTPLALTSLSQTIAPKGDSIVLAGTGLSAVASNDTVAFGSVPATVTRATETELTVIVPGGLTGPVEVKVVRVDQGVASNTLTFYPWVQTVPVVVSGARTDCTVFPSNTGRKIAAAANGFIYAGFMCGGQGYVTSSYDAGATFSPAVAI